MTKKIQDKVVWVTRLFPGLLYAVLGSGKVKAH